MLVLLEILTSNYNTVTK